MKLLVITNDPVQGTELADALRHAGHPVVRAWSAGEALLLARSDRPTLAIIDRCHGDDPEAAKLADYLSAARVDVLWLGEATGILPQSSNALIAALKPPCDARRVSSAIEAIAENRVRSDGVNELPAGLTLLTR